MFRFFYLIFFSQIVLSQGELISRYHTYDDIIDSLSSWQTSFSNNLNPSPFYSESGIIFNIQNIGESTTEEIPIILPALFFIIFVSKFFIIEKFDERFA